MKVYVETNPETIYSGRVKYEVKTTEIRKWFETDEEIEVLPLVDYTKQVRKEVCEEIRNRFLATCQIEKGCDTASFSLGVLNRILDQIEKGENEYE